MKGVFSEYWLVLYNNLKSLYFPDNVVLFFFLMAEEN